MPGYFWKKSFSLISKTYFLESVTMVQRENSRTKPRIWTPGKVKYWKNNYNDASTIYRPITQLQHGKLVRRKTTIFLRQGAGQQFGVATSWEKQWDDDR